MKAAYALALVGILALLSPAVSARQLKQDTSAITDADILNFALNLEVSGEVVHSFLVTDLRDSALTCTICFSARLILLCYFAVPGSPVLLLRRVWSWVVR